MYKIGSCIQDRFNFNHFDDHNKLFYIDKMFCYCYLIRMFHLTGDSLFIVQLFIINTLFCIFSQVLC